MKTRATNSTFQASSDLSQGVQGTQIGAEGNHVRRVRFGGLTTICHAPSSAVGSAALLEHILESRHLGAPPHRHANEDEISHVLSGQLVVLQDGQTSTAGPGETIIKPRGVMHTFWNPGDEPVRFLEVIAPGTGLEHYFEEIAPLIPDEQAPDIPGVMAVAARYGIEFDMSDVPELLQAHGLRL